MMKCIAFFLTFLSVSCFGVTEGHAHKVVASVYASGGTIEGEVGMSNGDMAADALIEVYDEAGRKLGETRTDADGIFVFTPTEAVTHVFKANLGAGHVATAVMPVADLPRGLKASAVKPETAATSAASAGGASSAAQVRAAALNTDEIAAMIRAEVKPLRREIAAYKEKNDMQSILGGIGYILGLFGIGFYVAARRKKGEG